MPQRLCGFICYFYNRRDAEAWRSRSKDYIEHSRAHANSRGGIAYFHRRNLLFPQKAAITKKAMDRISIIQPKSFRLTITPPWCEQAPCFPILGDIQPSAQLLWVPKPTVNSVTLAVITPIHPNLILLKNKKSKSAVAEAVDRKRSRLMTSSSKIQHLQRHAPV